MEEAAALAPPLPPLADPIRHEHTVPPAVTERFGAEIVAGCLLGACGAVAMALYMARRRRGSYTAIKRDDPVEDEEMLVPIDRVLDDDLVEHHLQEPNVEEGDQRAVSGHDESSPHYRF